MTRAFRFYPVEVFPVLTKVGDDRRTEHQHTLPLGLGEDDEISSRMELLGLSEHEEYTKYHVSHERIRTLTVRFRNEIRSSVITVIEFNIFLRKGGNFLWTDSPRYVEEFFNRLAVIEPDFEFTPREINLTAMRRAMTGDITGGWFRDIQVAHVSSAGIFGAGVTESTDWDRYETAGQISALTISADTEVGQMTFQVTHEGTIVLYQTFAERLVLEILDGLNEIVRTYEVPTI